MSFRFNLFLVCAFCICGAFFASSAHAASELYVHPTNSTSSPDLSCTNPDFNDIEQAYLAADPGATVHICPGTYVEPGFAVRKSVHFVGPMAGVPATDPSRDPSNPAIEAILTGDLSGSDPGFRMGDNSNPEITITGLSYDGLVFRDYNVSSPGVGFFANVNDTTHDFTIQNSIFDHINATLAHLSPREGFSPTSSANSQNWTITHNQFLDIGRYPHDTADDDGDGTPNSYDTDQDGDGIENFSDPDFSPHSKDHIYATALNLWGGAGHTVANNHFERPYWSAVQLGSHLGVADTTVTDNIIHSPGSNGIQIRKAENTDLLGNTITQAGLYHPYGDGAINIYDLCDGTIQDNVVSDSRIGIAAMDLAGSATDADLDNCQIRQNSFTGSVEHAAKNLRDDAEPGTLPATENYWGSADGPDPALIFGEVSVCPYLDSHPDGTLTDTGTICQLNTNTPPTLTLDLLTLFHGTVRPFVRVDYTLTDAESDLCNFNQSPDQVQYATSTDGPWTDAEIYRSVDELDSSPEGVAHNRDFQPLYWSLDGLDANDYYLRLRPHDGTAPASDYTVSTISIHFDGFTPGIMRHGKRIWKGMQKYLQF